MAQLPNEVYKTVEEVAAKYNKLYDNRIPKEAFGPALEEICCKHPGFGLSEKLSGANVPWRDTYVAEDIIQRESDNNHWDVFIGAKPGSKLVAGEIDHGVMRDPSRKFLKPVCAGIPNPNPDPNPNPEHKPPTVGLPPDSELNDFAYQLEDLYRTSGRYVPRETYVDPLGYGRWEWDYSDLRRAGWSHEDAKREVFNRIRTIWNG